MHQSASPLSIRSVSPDLLHELLQACRSETLAVLSALADHLGESLVVPYKETLNPPLWEFGHLLWFEEFWIHRNPQRRLGLSSGKAPASPGPSNLSGDEAWYNSALLAHRDRWAPPPMGFTELFERLQTQHALTLRCLEEDLSALDGGPWQPKQAVDIDYFYRLVIGHELMHLEAFYLMARDLEMPISLSWMDGQVDGAEAGQDLAIEAQMIERRPASERFHFDNEMGGLRQWVDRFSMSAQAVSVADYAAFMADGGYERSEHWTTEGWAWKTRHQRIGPSGHQPQGSNPLGTRWIAGRWQDCDPKTAIAGVSFHEAEAWCRWAGRRLPTEAEWLAASDRITPSQRWEWTASCFEAFDGFVPHPYRDYSAPWFGTHQVLKGYSEATHPALRDPIFRNFYQPHRGDLLAGFRTVALSGSRP